MDIPPLLKTAIAELDVNLEEELSRYQYWRKHGKAPTIVSKFTQRAKPRPIPPEPVVPPPPPAVDEPEVAVAPTNNIPFAPPPASPPEKENWLDFPTVFAALALMVVLGTVGYILADMFQLDRAIPKPDSPKAQTQTEPQSQPAPKPIAVSPPSPAPPPVSVRPPLPDPRIENLPPVQPAPPAGEPSVPEQNLPVKLYRVVVAREYIDRVQALEPGAFIRPADGKVQVAALENRADAENLLRRLEEQNIPAQIEE
ncbi:MAG: hypothetical protein RMK91_11170 [Pseudanabaenaceae cyanobacterium SKYGB_i_bin29]|nr:hypothetical protein [Pseudanabaenaceae cyanobacterium SKYG29]MDW8422415.1 hypothetical protein [Pseudanabaenaceae cyanobacterium SKYGB_i_bin29]